MRLAGAFVIGLLLGAVLTVTEPAESAAAAGPNYQVILTSCLNGGFVVDGELWICTPSGGRAP